MLGRRSHSWFLLTIVTGVTGDSLNIFFLVYVFKIFFIDPGGHPHHTPGDIFVFIRVACKVPASLRVIAPDMAFAASYTQGGRKHFHDSVQFGLRRFLGKHF